MPRMVEVQERELAGSSTPRWKGQHALVCAPEARSDTTTRAEARNSLCKTPNPNQVVGVSRAEGLSQVDIRLPPGKAANIQIGASVAVNGTCLTVTRADGDLLSFDIMAETLRATNLGGLDSGSRVNYERSARVGDEIGGHNVSGHVHTKARIVKVEDTPNNRRVVFELQDAAWIKYILPKGYVAVDGCSLTVGEVEGATFSVYLIPETLRVTVFGVKTEGDSVNIEVESQTQAIVDTVERVVERYMAQRGL